MEPDRDSTSLRVASFACYLDTAKDSIVHRVSSQDSNPNSTAKPPFSIKFSKPRDAAPLAANLQRIDAFSYLNRPIQDPTSAFSFSQDPPKDGEISVFGADKYFNMKLEHPNPTEVIKQHKQGNTVPVNPPPVVPNVKPGSPSLRSEASSYNSQVPLMSILPQKIESQVKQKRLFGKRIFTGFGCKGPCFNAKSICTDQTIAREVPHISKPIQTGLQRINPPIPTPAMDKTNLIPKKHLEDQILDESRHSIEVFGSRMTSKGTDVAANMQRKLSILTWDAIPKGQCIPTSATACDDMASEASSDLFEIENISGSTYPQVSSELVYDIPSCMMSPTSHYAPSEASIQWSIATASAVEYIIPSDYNDVTYMSIGPNIKQIDGTTASRGGTEAQRSQSGSLLGCNSQKSVDVADIKTNNLKKNQAMDFSVPLGISQANQGRVKVDHIDTLQLPIMRSFTSGLSS